MNLDQLEARAKAATPGPWRMYADPEKGDPYGRVRYSVVTLGKTITRIYYSSYEGGPTNAGDDAAYIAAFDPPTVLRLIAVTRAAKQAETLLTNLQPHIPQSCYPGREAFIDNYVDPAISALRSAIAELNREGA